MMGAAPAPRRGGPAGRASPRRPSAGPRDGEQDRRLRAVAVRWPTTARRIRKRRRSVVVGAVRGRALQERGQHPRPYSRAARARSPRVRTAARSTASRQVRRRCRGKPRHKVQPRRASTATDLLDQAGLAHPRLAADQGQGQPPGGGPAAASSGGPARSSRPTNGAAAGSAAEGVSCAAGGRDRGGELRGWAGRRRPAPGAAPERGRRPPGLPQFRAGLHSEIVHQHAPDAAKRGKRVTLAPGTGRGRARAAASSPRAADGRGPALRGRAAVRRHGRA